MSVSVANNDANISGQTVILAGKDATITGLQTFDRDPSAPFAVSASSAVVPNLDADKLDGYEAAAFGQLAAAQTWTGGQRAGITALTDGATITPNFNDNCNFSVTLGGNRTLANPTNLTAGQSGSIFITQDGTGSRTLAYGSSWDFAGGVTPTLSTGASAVDRLDYIVRTTTSIHASLSTNWS